MAKKEFFLIIDSETTIKDNVFDFAAVIVDRKGEIHAQCAIVIHDFINEPLFYIPNEQGTWSKEYSIRKRAKYDAMMANGSRMVASVAAINRWLEKANVKYEPSITAYNYAFDRDKCGKSGIDLTIFKQSFCLWHMAVAIFAKKKAYREFVLENHYFRPRTGHGNLTFITNAEVMAHFVTGQFSEEPHTALEDIIGYELPIFAAIAKKRDWKHTDVTAGYNWRDFQLKNNFAAKAPARIIPFQE